MVSDLLIISIEPVLILNTHHNLTLHIMPFMESSP